MTGTPHTTPTASTTRPARSTSAARSTRFPTRSEVETARARAPGTGSPGAGSPGSRVPGPDMAGQAGMMSLELAIAFPVIIVMLLVVVAFGRVTHGRQLVDEAAAVASRDAALATTPGQATERARASALATLTEAGVSCQNPRVDVDTTAFRPGGQVSVVLSCSSDLSRMALIGLPGHLKLTSTARTPIEHYRDLDGGESS
jgi:hypothetical protein